MVQLQKDLPRLREAGIRVAAISYDSEKVLKEFAAKQQIKFPLLSDAGSRTINAYHVRNAETDAGSRQDGIPHPGTFLVDSTGIIRAKLFYSVRKRHAPDELIEAAEAIR